MKALFGVAMILAAGALAAAAGVYLVMDKKVENLEKRLEPAETAVEPRERAPSTPAAEKLSMLDARVSVIEERIENLPGRRAASPERARVEGMPGALSVPGMPGPGGWEAGEAPLVFEDVGSLSRYVQGRIRKLDGRIKNLEDASETVRKKLENAEKEPKPSFERFAGRLQLDEGQKAAVKNMLVKNQERLLDYLSRPLEDGTIMVDALSEVFYQGMTDPEKAQAMGGNLFKRMLAEKVPGTEKTYLETVETMNDRLSGEMKRIMTQEQAEEFEAWAPKPVDIDLEDEGPLGRYVMEYIQRRQAEEGTAPEEK